MHPLIRVGIRLAVAAAALGLLFYFVPFDQVARALADLHPQWMLAGVLLQYVLRAVATVRMKPIAESQSIRLSHSTLFRILLAAQFYSMVLPGPLAGGGATWFKYVQRGASRDGAAVAILLNRAIGFIVMIPLGAAALVLDPRASYAGVGMVALLGGTTLLVLANARWSRSARRDTAAPRSRLRQIAHGFRERLLLFGRMSRRDKVIVLVSSVAYEITGAAIMWCFAHAADLALSLLTVVWIRAALQVVLILPITIAGLGIREAGLVGAGALIGIPAATAVTWSLTIFVGTLVVAATGGLLEATGLAGRVLRARGSPHDAGSFPVNGPLP